MLYAHKWTLNSMPIKSDLLLKWYQKSQRNLPWRLSTPNPYLTLLSEFLLQQTQVITVIPYFQRFISRWPTLHDLAMASLDEILNEWQGLGYYSRARNLHKCANRIVENYQGIIPSSEKELLDLPGIGPYTAAAISAIAFDAPSVVVDGNVSRIISRLYALESSIKQNTATIRTLAAKNTPQKNNGEYAQALMDLGSSICRPTIALCEECPLQNHCEAYALGSPLSYPEKEPKKEKPVYYSVGYLFIQNESILLRKRTHNKMLHGLWEIPCNNWDLNKEAKPLVESFDFRVEHVFSHFKLISDIIISNQIPKDILTQTEKFIPFSEIPKKALSSLTKKIIEKAFC